MQLGQVGVLQGLLHRDALAGIKLEHALHQIYRLGRGVWIHRPEVDPLHQQCTLLSVALLVASEVASVVASVLCESAVQQLCLAS